MARRIEEALAQSGERERLKAAVRVRLERAGWLESVRQEVESTFGFRLWQVHRLLVLLETDLLS